MRNHPVLISLLAALTILVAACSSSESGEATNPTPESTGEGASAVPDVPLTVTLNPLNVLSAMIELTTRDAVSLTVVAEGADGHTVEMPAGPSGVEHALPLLGLRPDTRYTLDLVADGQTVATGEVQSGSLPEGLPQITLGQNDPERISEGLTLMDVIPFTFDDLDDSENAADDGDRSEEPDSEPTDAGYIVMVDSEGEIVWYHGPLEQGVIGVELTPANSLLFSYNHMTLREIDLMGNTIGEWVGTIGYEKLVEDQFGRPLFSDAAVPVAAESLHHEIEFLPNGNVLTLSTELVEIVSDEQLCVDEIDDGDGVYPSLSDIVVELDLANDAVVGEWPLFSALDPNADPASSRVCDHAPSVNLVPNFMYPEVEGGSYDWTHANAVVLDEANNVLIVSARHLDALLGIRYQDDEDGAAGELLWSMGPGGDFELLDGEWWSFQHSPEIQADGTLLLYDNGNRRPDAPGEVAPGILPPGDFFEPDPDNPPYSRAVLVDYDTEARTVTQVWEHVHEFDGRAVYAGLAGDADRLDNGNVLIVHALTEAGAFVVEVDPGASSGGDVVSELILPEGYVIYRAERIPVLSDLVQPGS